MCIGEKFPIWNAMIVLILISFPSRAYTQTGIHILHTPSTITAVLGQDMTIPCLVARNDNQELDLSAVNVGWTKRSSSGNIHDVYQYLGHRDKKFRPGSLIEENELKRGNASLTLHHVQRSDEGKYTCRVFITPYKATAEVDVHLLAQPDVTLSSAELIVEPGREKSLACEVTRFYPEAVKIRWVKYRKGSGTRSTLDKATFLSVPDENSDGTFNASSLLTVRPSSLEEDGDLYSCVVTHLSFNQDQAINFTLTVKEPTTSHLLPLIILLLFVVVVTFIIVFFLHFMKSPQISRITGAEYLVHMKKSNLNFFILDFIPKTVNINVYLKRVNDSEMRQICSRKPSQEQTEHQNHDETIEAQPLNREDAEADNLEAELEPLSPKRSLFFYSCQCTLRITPNIETDDGAELTVQVEHPALKSPISQQCTLQVKGDCFNLSPIITQKTPIHGEEVTLTCNITKYSPGPLQIIWLKEDMMKLKPTLVIHRGEHCEDRYSHKLEEHQTNRVFSYSSSLTFTAKISEDHGKIYICQVNYAALSQNKQTTYNTYLRAVPVLAPITSKPAIPSADQKMVFSCNILRFYPPELTVEWYKGDDLVPHTGDRTWFVDGLYNVMSTLKLTLKLEDLGKTLRCKVGHESLENPMIKEWTLKQPLEAAKDDGPKATMKKEETLPFT